MLLRIWRVARWIILAAIIVGIGVLLVQIGRASERKTAAEETIAANETVIATNETVIATAPEATATAMPVVRNPTATPTTIIAVSATAVLEATTEEVVLNGIPKGETANIPAGRAVMGDVTATWPGFDVVMAAYDNGGSGEGTILWVSISSGTASVHAAWGAGQEICTSQEDALLLVEQELRQGCGKTDTGGCNSVRLVTLRETGTSIDFFHEK